MRIEIRSVLDHIARRAPRLDLGPVAAAAIAAALGGCSLSLPSERSLVGVDYSPTGSIAAPAVAAPASPAASVEQPCPLSPRLDAEDWRRARAALGVALDPQGDGSTVAWSNPQSGRRGSFAALAAPYPVDGEVCRAFAAKVEGAADLRLQGSACRIGGTDDWEIKDVRSTRES